MKPASFFALLLLFGSTVLGQSTFDGCPGIGNAKPANVQQLNLLKNRDNPPKPGDIDPTASVAALQEPGDDTNRWNSQHGAVFHAYVINVIPGGRSETANCKKGDPVHRDTHIELISDPSDSAPERRVIVEVTPRWRAKMLAQGVDWSTTTLEKTIKNHWVTVTGWLMFDEEHANESQNTNPDGDSNWRATAWEIHPITALSLDEPSPVGAAGKKAPPLKGKVTRVDPEGSSFEMLTGGAARTIVADAAAIAAVKNLKAGDLAAAEVPAAGGEAKAAKVEVPVFAPSAVNIALALLIALIVTYLLTKLFLGGKPTRDLVIGVDGRYSNSKFQMTLWFGVLVVTYLAAVGLRAWGSNGALVGGVDIPTNLLMLSGLSALSFAGAKAITTSNIKKPTADTSSKTDKAPNVQPVVAPSPPHRTGTPTQKRSFPGDLVNDDYGILSFARFQIMVITLIAVIVYLGRIVSFFANVKLAGSVSLPDVDTTILAAFGLGQGAYLTNKVVSPES